MFKEPRCELLGPFALVVQGSLGLIAVLSLVVKRNYEHPPRPWWIWFFDVLKQVIGAGCLHFLNLLQSIIFSNSGEPDLDKNPCTWYFLNVLLDTTIGVPVLWFFLYFVHSAAYRFGVRQIVSGQYGHPPKWIPFFKQALLYLVALVSMKLLLYLFVWWMPMIDDLGNFLISWSNFDARVQVAFVVLIFPLIMNTLQYYLVDSIIQSPEYHNPKLAQLAPDAENRPTGPPDSDRSDLPTQAHRPQHAKGKQKSTNQANETTRLLSSH
uniref:ARAD1C27874p n=1 Tax=Blastobotrys adeninivorans TaxID=409370 RepID=A0A060T2D2_BLAAD